MVHHLDRIATALEALAGLDSPHDVSDEPVLTGASSGS
jgi:hypothetical protein